jgi:hypothetical protein
MADRLVDIQLEPVKQGRLDITCQKRCVTWNAAPDRLNLSERMGILRVFTL